LPLDDRYPSRDESWAALSPKVRGRLTELAGDVIEWFAWKDPYSSENRSRAVILGTRAFCLVGDDQQLGAMGAGGILADLDAATERSGSPSRRHSPRPRRRIRRRRFLHGS
jgi:hypothetical protein